MIEIKTFNKIEEETNSLNLINYEPLRVDLSKILENQRISKKKTRSNIRNYPKRIHWDSPTKPRAFTVKRPTEAAIKNCCRGIKCHQRRTGRKGSSEGSLVQTKTFTQA